MEKFVLKNVVCREFNVNETLQCLRYPNPIVFFSWGASKFVNNYNQAFSMFVRGAKFKGHVYITLNGLDLYNVYLVTTKGNLKQKVEDIYFDQLQEVVDGLIES